MQEVMWLGLENRPRQLVDLKVIAKGFKWLVLAIWRPISWVFEAMFVPHPWQERIEEHRNRARMMGHF